MKIAIDGRGALLYRGTGIGTYTWRLLSALCKSDNVRILLPGEELKGFTFADDSILDYNHNSHEIWENEFLPRTLAAENIDIFHVPQNGLGLPLKKQCTQTVTIHDMIPYVFPETVGKGYLKEFLGKMPKVMAESDGIITVSQTSKKDIMDIFDYPQDKIVVIAEAAEPIYKPMAKDMAKKYLQENYNITEDYFIYVGGYGMRKNVKTLILAYYLLRKDEDIKWQLVLPGKRSSDFDRLDVLVEALGLKDHVVFPGFIPVKDMPYFYGGAEIMVYPSIYEGFGLPPLEAMAMGIPVISSNRSSLPEVLGDAPVYFDAFDTVKLAELMLELYEDEGKRKALSLKSLERAKLFSWQKTVKETKQFWEHTFYDI
ncbi:MAG: glycosyltransferase family 1 protein [Clostridiales bacterium]